MAEKKNTPSIMDEAENDMKEAVLEEVMGKIGPFIKPTIKKIVEFLGDDEYTCILKKEKGQKEGMFIVIKSANLLLQPNLPEDENEANKIIAVTELGYAVEKALSGKIEELAPQGK